MFKCTKMGKSSFFCAFYSAFFHRGHLQFSCPISIGLLARQRTKGRLLLRTGTRQTGTSQKGFSTKTRDCPVLPSLHTSLFREIPKICSERCLSKYLLMFKSYMGPKLSSFGINRHYAKRSIQNFAFPFLNKVSSSKLQVVESLSY